MKTSTLESAKIVIFDLGILKVIVDLENKQITKNTNKTNYYSECVEEWNKRTIGDLDAESKYTFGQFLFQIVNREFYGVKMQLWYNVFGDDGIEIIEYVEPEGCKYCGCSEFVEKVTSDKDSVHVDNRGRINYEKYKWLDLDALTPRQKQVMEMKISGLRVKEIVEKTGMSQSHISTLLHDAGERLNGRETYSQIYYRKNREKIKQYREKHKEEIKEVKRVYLKEHREEILKKQKDYNKKYYEENRERISTKKKENYKKKKE